MCLLLNSQCTTVEIQNNYHNSWIQYRIYGSTTPGSLYIKIMLKELINLLWFMTIYIINWTHSLIFFLTSYNGLNAQILILHKSGPGLKLIIL